MGRIGRPRLKFGDLVSKQIHRELKYSGVKLLTDDVDLLKDQVSGMSTIIVQASTVRTELPSESDELDPVAMQYLDQSVKIAASPTFAQVRTNSIYSIGELDITGMGGFYFYGVGDMVFASDGNVGLNSGDAIEIISNSYLSLQAVEYGSRIDILADDRIELVATNIHAQGSWGVNDALFYGDSETELVVRRCISDLTEVITGSGHISVSGNFSSATSKSYKAEITTGGEIGTALFRWSDDGGSTWDESDKVTSKAGIALNNNLFIYFSSGIGTDFIAGDYVTWYSIGTNDQITAFRVDSKNDMIYITANVDMADSILDVGEIESGNIYIRQGQRLYLDG